MLRIPRGVFFLPLAVAIMLPAWGGELDFDSNRAFKHLLTQCEFGPRYSGTSGHQKTITYIRNSLTSCGLQVLEQPFRAEVPLLGGTRKFVNIIGIYRPQEKEKFALSCHWDTRSIADRDPVIANRRRPILGANDGASGVAVLLEVARIVARRELAKGMIFVFFDAEDLGRAEAAEEFCLGSKYFVQHVPPECERIIGGINVDMVGDKDLEFSIEELSYQHARPLIERFWRVGESRYPTQFTRSHCGPIIDDHVPFLRVGIQYMNLIDFRYSWWHTLADTPDKCSQASLKVTGDTLVRFLFLK